MKPTTDELIKIIMKTKIAKKKESYGEQIIRETHHMLDTPLLYARLQGRLDVFEEWLDYQLGVEECWSNNIWLKEEITKIKEVLK